MSDDYAVKTYTLTGLYIAKRNSDDTFETPLFVPDGQMLAIEPENETDEMRSYGGVSDGLSVPIKAKVSLKGGGYDSSVMAIVAGATVSESGASGNRVTTVDFPAGGRGLGYFGVIGTVAAKDGQIGVLGAEKIMLGNVPKYTADGEANKFNNMEAEGTAYVAQNRIYRLKRYEDENDFSAPTNGTEFAAFFA